MSNTTVDLDKPSFYSEPNSFLYRLKRKLTYKTILKILSKYINNSKDYRVLEIGTGSGFLASFLESKYKNINLAFYNSRTINILREIRLPNKNSANNSCPSYKPLYDFIMETNLDPTSPFINLILYLYAKGILLFHPNDLIFFPRIVFVNWLYKRNYEQDIRIISSLLQL